MSSTRRARRFGLVEVARAATQEAGESVARAICRRVVRNALSQAATQAIYDLREAEKGADAWAIAEARDACDKAHRYLAAHEAGDVTEDESEAA